MKSSGKGSSYNTTAKPQNDEVTYDSSILACWMCSKPHKIWNCDAFNSKTVEDRRSSAKDLKLCYNCLSNNHQIKTCQSRLSCKVCNGRHHTLLHVNKGEDTKHSKIGYGSTHHTTEEERVFLQVIPVTISHGEIRIETNALLDCGSDTTLIKRNLSEKLNLQGKSRHLEISNVLEERKVVKSKVVNFDLSSVFHPDSVLVENAWVVEELNVEPHSVNLVDIKDKFDHLKLLPISYPIDKEVGILIGADFPEALLHLDFRKGEKEEPIAVKTLFGWTLFGGKSGFHRAQANFISTESIGRTLEQFWRLESYGTLPLLSPSLLTKDEKLALEILNQTTLKRGSKFEIGMLWKENEVVLKNNRQLAVCRLKSTERRLKGLPEIKQRYSNTIKEYLQDGHARKLSSSETNKASPKVNYVPHHFVLNRNKPEKLRIVFDAAAKYENESLNSHLLAGPDLLSNLVTVLSRFRFGNIAVISDIEKMFHQVLVPERDQDALRFLWREEDTDVISEYQMMVHLFGKKDSPCCANWALKQCATEENNVQVAEAIRRNFYMDDYLGSFSSLKEAKEVSLKLISTLQNNGFRLTKWISNSSDFLQMLPKSEISSKVSDLKLDCLPVERTLGVWWDSKTDEFHFNFKRTKHHATKRGLLSFVSSIFDPLGFLTPFLVTPKLLMQSLWSANVGWDEKISNEIINDFKTWKEGIQESST